MSTTEEMEALFSRSSVNISFQQRNESIPGDLRMSWRLAVFCILLNRFRAKEARIEHLHTMWWSIRSEKNQELVLRWFQRKPNPDEIIVRYDPSLSTTIDLASGQGLADIKAGGKIKLSSSGIAFAEDIWRSEGTLEAEKRYLSELPRSISQQSMKDMTEWR